jgi:hypothetical protein
MEIQQNSNDYWSFFQSLYNNNINDDLKVDNGLHYIEDVIEQNTYLWHVQIKFFIISLFVWSLIVLTRRYHYIIRRIHHILAEMLIVNFITRLRDHPQYIRINNVKERILGLLLYADIRILQGLLKTVTDSLSYTLNAIPLNTSSMRMESPVRSIQVLLDFVKSVFVLFTHIKSSFVSLTHKFSFNIMRILSAPARFRQGYVQFMHNLNLLRHQTEQIFQALILPLTILQLIFKLIKGLSDFLTGIDRPRRPRF